MRTSFLTSVALGAAMVNAGVIKKRASNGLNVVYWGQDDPERSLGSYCAAGQGIDVIVLAFLSKFGDGNTPSGSFGDECNINSSGSGSCNTLANDIDTCAIESDAPRPIGDTFIDGWDFDIESNPHNSGQYLGELVKKLRSYIETDPSHTYYISGAPQCPIPEENMGLAITSAQFDWLFIQFYNNDECSAYQLFEEDGGSFNYDSWVDYVSGTASENAKLFVGVPASEDASTGDSSGSKYWVSTTNLPKLVSEYSSHSQWGGVMLWDAGNSDTVSLDGCNYAQQVHSVLTTGCWVAATAMASQLALPPPAVSRREPAEPIEPELKLSELLLELTPMAARPLPEADALLRTATTLILSVDRAMDRLLSLLPTAAWPPAQLGPEPGPEPEPDQAEDIAIQQALDEVLEYHRTHRPPNTAKNYEPKQREWKAWCKKIGFKEGGKYLPGDYVDKGKLLLFIKNEVASCAPKRGGRLEAEK
ncbi:hypothetical protein B7463_g6810, partial [Scytalidium lignicola]